MQRQRAISKKALFWLLLLCQCWTMMTMRNAQATPTTRPVAHKKARASNPLRSLSLDSFLWKHRLLFFNAPNASSLGLLRQWKRRQKLEPEIKDRDLQLFVLFSKGRSVWGKRLLSKKLTRALRRHWKFSNKAEVILVGKDGTIKLRKPLPVRWKDIFGLIDSMPMRQEEMRRK